MGRNKPHIRHRTAALPRRGLETTTGDEEGESSPSLDDQYIPTPCSEDISNDGPACPELPQFYGPCDTPTEASMQFVSEYSLTIGFDYELYYSGAAPIDYLQGIILEHLASIWEIGCGSDNNGRSLQDSAVTLIALSSSPQDKLNEEGTYIPGT
jgi:hypothetical protein